MNKIGAKAAARRDAEGGRPRNALKGKRIIFLH